MKFKLRPYQIEAIHFLRKAGNKAILCLPTGSGKTVTFSHLAESAINKGSMVHVVCHRKELIDQAYNTMKAYGLPMHRIKFGMVQTYNRSPHKIPKADLTIIDECHIGNFRRFCDQVEGQTFIVGATATPLSASKKNPLNDTFKNVVEPVQIPELIEQGYLSQPTYHIAGLDLSDLELTSTGEYSEASQNKAFSDLFSMDTLRRSLDQIGDNKAIIFTPSIEIAEAVYNEYTNVPGYYLAHSKMSKQERDLNINAFKHDEKGKIINCSILTAGFDDPDISHVILYRATTSEPLYLQMVGRGSRVTPVKKHFHVWDLGQNYKRFTAWHTVRDWKKKFENQGKKLKLGEAPCKTCVNCEALISASARTCDICLQDQPKPKPKEQQTAQGFTVMEYGQSIPDHLKKPWHQMSVKELLERATYGSSKTGRPYKMGWVLHQIKERPHWQKDLYELARLKNYKKGWIQRQLEK